VDTGAAVTLTWRLPPEPAVIAAARQSVDTALAVLGVAADQRYAICLLISEACTNVVRHAGTGDPFELTVAADPAGWTVTVTDFGVGVDRRVLERPLPAPSQVDGRGLYLMRSLADEVTLDVVAPRGTRVRMVKRLVG